MDLIYGNAWFTICAADGADSNAGLLALTSKDMAQPRLASVAPGVRLTVSENSKSVFSTLEWDHRAWTFQERILSRRCVIFAEARLYFQCRQTNWWQDDNLRSMAENGMASAWRALLHRAYEHLERRPIRFYMASVEAYTGSNLSYGQDILKAFHGVSRLIELHICAALLFGLPTSHFDLALLWKPLVGKRRRNLEDPGPSNQGYDRDDLEFPSWSWCGWMDSDDPGKGAGVIYDAGFLGGCLGYPRLQTRTKSMHLATSYLSHRMIPWT